MPIDEAIANWLHRLPSRHCHCHCHYHRYLGRAVVGSCQRLTASTVAAHLGGEQDGQKFPRSLSDLVDVTATSFAPGLGSSHQRRKERRGWSGLVVEGVEGQCLIPACPGRRCFERVDGDSPALRYGNDGKTIRSSSGQATVDNGGFPWHVSGCPSEAALRRRPVPCITAVHRGRLK